MACQAAHPEFCQELTWDNVATKYLLYPVIVLASLVVAFLPISLIWNKMYDSPLLTAMRQYVGTPDENPKKSLTMSMCFGFQMVFSFTHVVLWVERSYSHKVTSETYIVEVVTCAFFVFHFFLLAWKNEFSPWFPLSAPAMIDVFTVVPVLASVTTANEDIPWLSASYLRVFRCLTAFERVRNSGALGNYSEVTVALIHALLKTVTLVVVLAGTVMILEILEDPEFLQETFVTTNMGDLSFVQMTYWIFTTISTVGYGDFSPTTLLSRLFIIIAIIVGVTFFSNEIGNIVEIKNLEGSGRGKFKKEGKGNHVVVVGGGVANCSSTLNTFLGELFMPEHIVNWPYCSLMSMSEVTPAIQDLLGGISKPARARVNYFVGNPMSERDLERVCIKKATLVVVLADMQALDRDAEDEANILRAMALKQYHPELNLRLMMLRPQNLQYAVNVGLKSQWCFSAFELKSSLMAHSCRCYGWSTLMANILLAVDYQGRPRIDEQSWEEYQWGLGMEIYGFCANTKFKGMKFADFVVEARKFNVTPIAVQIDTAIKINPAEHVLKAFDVIFAFAHDLDAGESLMAADFSWQAIFRQNQMKAPDSPKAQASPDSMFPADDVAIVASPERQKAKNQPGGKAPVKVLPWMIADASKPKAESKAPGAVQTKARSNNVGGQPTMDLSEFEKLTERIASHGGHYMLVLLGDNLWQQAKAFVHALRAAYLPVHTPVVVFTAKIPGPETIEMLFHDSEAVSFAVGNPRNTKHLEKAGILTAKCVTMLSSAGGGDPRMIDGTGIITLASLEKHWRQENMHKPAILELQSQDSIKLISQKLSMALDSVSDEDALRRDPQKSNFNLQPRFASGGIFNTNCLGSLLADAYYTPGIIELFEALTFGEASNQLSFPFQLRLPKPYVGKTYGELSDMLLGKEMRAVPVGLYRDNLVLCCPRNSEKLQEHDLVYVLGSADFAELAKQQGILSEVPPPGQEDEKTLPSSPVMEVQIAVETVSSRPTTPAVESQPTPPNVMPPDDPDAPRADPE